MAEQLTLQDACHGGYWTPQAIWDVATLDALRDRRPR